MESGKRRGLSIEVESLSGSSVDTPKSMSSIPSNPAIQGAVARLQAQNAQKEREKDFRHREELQDLKAGHKVEVDRIREQSLRRTEEVQNESSVKLSERDRHHQKEIDSIKDIYSKRMADLKRED